MTDQLLEAHAPADFLSRVRALQPGEVARLQGGVAVKHLTTEDGRKGWQVGSPRTYDGTTISYDGVVHRSVDDAVRAAFKESARSTDPESIGGRTRLLTYGGYTLDGASHEVRIADFTTDGKAVVSGGAYGGTRTVDPAKLQRPTPIRYEELNEDAWGGKPGTNWKQVNPEARRRLSGIVRHYMRMAHPFTACVRDNTKRFGKERAERVCAVVKDLGSRTTRWRRGGVKEAEVEAALGRLLEAAAGDVDGLEHMMLLYIAEGEGVQEALSNKARAGDSDYGVRPYTRSMESRWSKRRRSTTASSGDFESKHKRAPAGSATGGQFVRKGDSGEPVRSVQSRLGLAVTGSFDAGTAAAVAAFQRRHGLAVDGIVGRQTALALSGQFERAKAAAPGALGDYTRSLVGRGFRRPRRRAARPERVGGGLLVK